MSDGDEVNHRQLAVALHAWLRAASYADVREVASRCGVAPPVFSAVQMIALHANTEQWLDFLIGEREILIAVSTLERAILTRQRLARRV